MHNIAYANVTTA